jgi:predicted Zn-dependent protease
MTRLADDARIEALTRDMAQGANAAERIEALIVEFPDDARLHFLKGSSLIGEGRHIEGHQALTRAVALAPDFAIARFQLGLFQLTSGEADRALETWGPTVTICAHSPTACAASSATTSPAPSPR